MEYVETKTVNGVEWIITRGLADFAGNKIPFWSAESDDYQMTASGKRELNAKLAAFNS